MENKHEMVQEPIEGTALNLGGTVFIVPPVSLGWLKVNKVKMKAIMSMETATPDQIMDVLPDLVDVLQAAIRRNYPDITVEQLSDVVDMRNFEECLKAAMGKTDVTLTVKGASGEAKPPTSSI
jgi:hypothetical protein